MNNNGTINILKFVAKTISECIIEITKDIDLSRAIEPLKPFIESIKEFKEIMEHVAPICQQKMFNSGWVPLLPPSAPIVEFVAEVETAPVLWEFKIVSELLEYPTNPPAFGLLDVQAASI